MASSRRPSEQRSETSRQIASQFGLLALCLLMLYALVVLAAILPLRLLDPGWQLRFTHALINNGFLALLGLALAHLAAYVDPSNPHLIRRRNTFAALALVAVLGFLMLIPLQGYAVWRGISMVASQRNGQLQEVTGNIAAVREAITRSSSTTDLQRRLQDLRIPPLSAAEVAQPLPVLRKAMLESLERSEIRARDRLTVPPSGVWRILQDSIRSGLSAVVLMVGFAGFSRRTEWRLTLLQQWQERISGRSRRRSKRVLRGAGRLSVKDFLTRFLMRTASTSDPSQQRRRG